MYGWPTGLRFRPLAPNDWPGPRAMTYKQSPFDATLGSTQELLDRELRMVRAADPVIQIELSESQIRLDGLPRADARPARPGVIIAFTHPQVGPLRYPCERFRGWQDNVRAIALGLEALRKVERYGITTDHQQYRGWRAIEYRSATPVTPVDVDEALAVIAKYANVDSVGKGPVGPFVRAAQRATHPDTSDFTTEDFEQVQAAVTVLRKAGRL